jgi:hypothetical protein
MTFTTVKAACHIHSDWSYDGKWTLAELALEFARQGYQVVMMTEHDRGFSEARRQEHRAACTAVSNKDLLVLPGIEYSDAGNDVHVLVWGPVSFVGENVPTADLLKAVKAADGVAVFAHPSRRQAWKLFDPAWAADLLGIEVWNRKMDGWSPSRRAYPLLAGTRAIPFVGMDFHDRRQLFPLAMQLEIATPVTEDSVLECLRARRCHPMAFDRPVHQVAGGLTGFALASAELVRRSAARASRPLRTRQMPPQAARKPV